MTINETPTMLDVATDALEHGYAVVPPKEDGSKRPDGEWKQYQQRLPTIDEINAWYHAGRSGIGVVTGAVSGNLEMLEFEGRAMEESIGDQFADLAGQAGLTDLVDRINAGYCETTPTGGLHLLYRVTGPVAGNLKLARRPATPDELAAKPDDPIRVLIETRGEGGYVVVAPSHGRVHPTGNEWVLLNGGFDQVAVISEDERDQLHAIARALDTLPAPARKPTVSPHPSAIAFDDHGDRPGDAYNTDPQAPVRTLQLLERHGWVEVFRRPHDGHQDVHLRRPGKDTGTSAVLHMDAGTLVVFSTSTTFEQEAGYTPFAVLAVLEHHGDYQHAARALRPPPAPGSAPFPIEDPTYAPLPTADGRPAAGDHLPDELWAARPVLEHVRQAARARMVSPDAVLGAVLTRVAAITPHTVELPAVVGVPVGLTYYVALTGQSEAGKSTAAGVAAQLIPAPPRVFDAMPPGSGEGMVDILFDLVTFTDEQGKKKTEKQQTKNAALFHIDEGAVLAELNGRSGSTLLTTIRSAWSHQKLGSTNASKETRRVLDGRLYVYGITMGLQPELAGPILDDVAAGTPQRFLWLSAHDPTATDDNIDWPGQLTWEPPDIGNLEPYEIRRGGYQRHVLDVAPAITAEMRADRLAAMRGTSERDPYDSHRMLLRLKTAALLALLDRRLNVNDDDWHLAGVILDVSRAVRRQVQGTLHAIAHAKENARIDQHTRRELAVEDSKETRALTSATRSIANIVIRHHETGEHNLPAGCTKSCLTRAVGGKHRDLIGSADVAIGEALQRGFIAMVDGRYTPGDARPA